MDVLSPFISVLCHFIDSSTESPVDVLMLSIQAVRGRPRLLQAACTWHCSLYYLFLQATPLFPHDVTIVC